MFCVQNSSTDSAPNSYRGVYPERSRRGGAWGYLTDPSGLQQLGARFYWPEVGRFISQDPIGDGVNWYAYVGSNPVVWVDPEGLRFRDWYMCGMGGASDLADRYLMFGRTANFGYTAGLYDSGAASAGQVGWAGAQWGVVVGTEAYGAAKIAGSVGYHPLSKHILKQTAISGRKAGRLHQAGKKFLHLNLPGRRHLVIHGKNWYKPWKWIGKGKGQ